MAINTARSNTHTHTGAQARPGAQRGPKGCCPVGRGWVNTLCRSRTPSETSGLAMAAACGPRVFVPHA
jgi:hypothetical protein